MPRADPETQLQIAAVNLLRLVLPSRAIIHHSHNEGKRSKRDAAIAKAMGQRAGFCDLMVLLDGTAYFIEFKSEKGRLSATQKQFLSDLEANGFAHHAVVRSIDELVGTLRGWGLAKRAVGNAGPLRRLESAGQTPIG